ncbi:auxin-responsive protein IAA1-like [Apium graveolens]|uniref:auxin-responsive protein IAA1-like n=1 Tax=Apium graveolens TaxID=4045 RepID=UPI003D7AA26D
MSPEMFSDLPESGMNNLKETELTLGLPGEPRVAKTCMKRQFSETVNLEFGNSGCQNKKDVPGNEFSRDKESAKSRGLVVGWPPVRAHRKNAMTVRSGKYVKVAVDGAPYLRKVDLEMYNSYEQLLRALEGLFTCFSIRTVLHDNKLMDLVNGVEYVPTYEDKDGDWMLVGDVPWKMFAESCKRVRVMTRSEANGLAPRPETKCSSSSS